jgi:hypothetical protein
MARRAALIKIKAKSQKKSKTEQWLVNRKYCGDEPTFTSKILDRGKHNHCFSWYSYMCDRREAHEYLIEYLKNVGRDTEANQVKNIPDKWLPTTICWTARMWSRGAVLPESSREFFEKRLKETLTRDYNKSDKMEVESSEELIVKRVDKTVYDRMSVLLEALICEIEEKIDEFITTWKPGFMMYDWLQSKQVPGVQAKRMFDFFNPQLLEIEDYFEGRLSEGYEGYSKDELKKLFGFYVMIVEDLEKYSNNSKKVRKPRAKKPITAEKKLKDFKYQKFDNVKKIQSIQPENIFGSSELWVFSTKYNQLTVFRTTDPSGLDVYRTSIRNFDPITSHTKKLKSKDVDNILREVQNAGKVSLRNILKNARGSDQKLQERINENTILVRVVK